jgi:hypothetical protein
MRKRTLWVLSGAALIALLAALGTPAANAQAAAPTPTIKGEREGSRVAVFETPKDSCEPNDIPDAMARAFRDSTGKIHFISASSDLY